jgi:hypothetical protein
VSALRQVFLFSGHMIDRRGRAHPRFPPEREGHAAAAIAAALDELAAGPGDLGMTEGACGGDLLFAEAMLSRGAALELRLPFDQETFLRESVEFEKPPSAVPDRWRERFLAVQRHRAARRLLMPEVLGPTPQSEDAYERCNLWLLRDALSPGAQRLRFVCLWDGGGDDGPGGTPHMIEQVRRHGGEVRWLDTRTLFKD